MLSAGLLIAALVAGKIGLAALTAADWTILAKAGFTAARVVIMVGAKVERDVHAYKLAHPANKIEVGRSTVPTPHLCFRGAPSGWSAQVCP